ncbi:MAG: amino acid adenylation domain-containing protein, partial [Algicola sp.]|nr:amino acid adenylation domain-containing protein [Algicola sp.]
YGDLAQWQKTTLTGDYLKPKLDYWASQLADCPQVHHLPLTQSRQAARHQSSKRKSGRYQQVIDLDLCNDLNDLCHKQQTTLFMLLQAAFAVHIGRCSFETDVMMGAPVAGRHQQVLEPMIGLLLNTQVFRTRFDDNPSFETLLNRTRQEHLEAAGFGDVPFELLVDKINPERSLNHSPLFQILINMDNTEQSQASLCNLSNLNKLTMTPLGDSRNLDAKYELTLYIKQSDDSLAFDWVYDSHLFNASTIAMMAREFVWLLQQFVRRPAQPVLSHSWSDSRGWLKNAHRHSLKAATQGSIAELFERQAKRVPNQIAVSCSYGKSSDDKGHDEQISYETLNQKANQLAHYLDQEWRILLNDRVAFATERGINRVVAILAVLKLGAVYVPLSAELPAKRLAGMLEDAKVHCILADTASLQWLQLTSTHKISAQTVITLDCNAVVSACAKHSTDNLIDRKINADTLAHIIYTSGSTGRPKGVLGSHGATVNRINWMLNDLPFEPNERPSHLSSMAFIRGVCELLVPLCGGVTLELLQRKTVKEPALLIGTIKDKNISSIITAPSMLSALCQHSEATGSNALGNLTYWFVSGEALPVSLARKAAKLFPKVNFYNLYGSTESLSDVLYTPVHLLGENSEYVPLGLPISLCAATIVDKQNNPVPDGVAGELVVTGENVALGYDGLFDLTQQQFIDTPLGKGYRTGDLGCVRADGQVAYLGRADHQIKIRGYRIELSEIEVQLSRLNQVEDVIVVVNTNKTAEEKSLVAYFTSRSKAPSTSKVLAAELITQVRFQLSLILPNYMVPAALVVLDQLPRLPNGKVNRSALPKVTMIDSNRAFVKPTTDSEKLLAKIWGELLQLDADQLSSDANYFESGG